MRTGDRRRPNARRARAAARAHATRKKHAPPPPPLSPFQHTTPFAQVVVRVRPPLRRETAHPRVYAPAVACAPCGRSLTLTEDASLAAGGPPSDDPALLYATHRFTFDAVHGPDDDQEDVYAASARPSVAAALAGYNAAIIAYGQTGAGKTHTMEGAPSGPARGIVPRAVEDAFAGIEADAAAASRFLVRASYLQIYNEVVSDLLRPERTNLLIREDARRGVYVEGLSEWVVRSPAEVAALMERGRSVRATGATKMNELSSRSHAVLTIVIERCAGGSGDGASASRPPSGHTTTTPPSRAVKVGKLHLVDLAGSERVAITGATGQRLAESKRINASLSALGNVIAALTSRGPRPHIPYRDSKLTRLLEDSLGGNCVTTLVATVSPSACAFPESLSTLKFATRAKTVVNAPRVNEDADSRTLLRRYEAELRRLRAELRERARTLVDKRALLAAEEERRRAEADKLAAITALEARSAEVVAAKEEKRALEARIAAMASQVLVGGEKVEDTPAFRSLLAAEHARIRAEYEARLRDLETERQAADADRTAADKYVALLLRQRDIMTGLTARLAERDGQLLALQEEVEAYDGRIQRLEDALDAKTTEVLALKRVAAEAEARGGVVTPRPPPVAVAKPGPSVVDVTAMAAAPTPVADDVAASDVLRRLLGEG